MRKKKLGEEKMTSAQKRKDTMLKKKYDDSDMKKNMQRQYGKEEGKKVYFATIRKQAMKKEEYIAELKPATLGRYIKQAGVDQRVREKAIEKLPKVQADVQRKKIARRQQGIGRAVNKLVKGAEQGLGPKINDPIRIGFQDPSKSPKLGKPAKVIDARDRFGKKIDEAIKFEKGMTDSQKRHRRNVASFGKDYNKATGNLYDDLIKPVSPDADRFEDHADSRGVKKKRGVKEAKESRAEMLARVRAAQDKLNKKSKEKDVDGLKGIKDKKVDIKFTNKPENEFHSESMGIGKLMSRLKPKPTEYSYMYHGADSKTASKIERRGLKGRRGR